MHMADALLSPATGLTVCAVSGAMLAYAARRVRQVGDERLVPLMGMLGAFVFAAQMINFAVPGTGSSGHLGGALLLAILLGPHAAFVVIASVLVVQALFFADGGLLALGANLFNLGVLPCYVGYGMVYRPLAGRTPGARREAVATVLAAVVGLQLGALSLVAQTVVSGISSVPAAAFLGLMLPIHLAIGVAEGLVTTALVHFLRRQRPEFLAHASTDSTTPQRPRRLRSLLIGLAAATALTAGVLSWFASAKPDGLEWSLARATAGASAQAAPQGLHAALQSLQQRIAWWPDYARPDPPPAAVALQPATSLAGLVGGAVTLALVLLVGLALRRRRVRR